MTTYSDARRAEATALAISLGPSGDKQAAKQFGIPARTIRRWVYLVKRGDQRGEAIVSAETREQVAERFWSVTSKGTERMLAALDDPTTPARDVARITEVAFTSHSLMAGGPTARTETVHRDGEGSQSVVDWFESVTGHPLSPDEKAWLADSIGHGESWLFEVITTELVLARQEGRQPVVIDPRGLPWPPDKPRSTWLNQPQWAKPAQLTDGRNGNDS